MPTTGLLARTPLRVRLVVALLTLVFLALVILGVTGTQLLRNDLLDRVDDQLTTSARPIAERVERRFPVQGPQRGGPDLNQYHLELKDESGATTSELTATLGTAVSQPDLPAVALDAVPPDGLLLTVPAEEGDGQWRAVVVRLSNGTQSLAVATSLDEVEGAVAKLRNTQLVVGLLVLVLLGWLAYYLVRASLRPLVDVERTAGAIAAGDLSRRVPDRDPRTEVGRLSRALNGMLQQIETAFRDRAASEAAARASEERMRRFVADASHELRTPLTSIRGFAELYRQGAAPGPQEAARIMGRIEDESRRMGLLVEDLLLLARLDQQRPLERRPVDLLTLAADAVHDARVIAPDRPVTLRVLAEDAAGEPEAPVVLGDAARPPRGRRWRARGTRRARRRGEAAPGRRQLGHQRAHPHPRRDPGDRLGGQRPTGAGHHAVRRPRGRARGRRCRSRAGRRARGARLRALLPRRLLAVPSSGQRSGQRARAVDRRRPGRRARRHRAADDGARCRRALPGGAAAGVR